jgi:hypothetical protein
VKATVLLWLVSIKKKATSKVVGVCMDTVATNESLEPLWPAVAGPIVILSTDAVLQVQRVVRNNNWIAENVVFDYEIGHFCIDKFHL